MQRIGGSSNSNIKWVIPPKDQCFARYICRESIGRFGFCPRDSHQVNNKSFFSFFFFSFCNVLLHSLTLSAGGRSSWFWKLVEAILQDKKDVLALLEPSPFPGHAPKYVRVKIYDYTFCFDKVQTTKKSKIQSPHILYLFICIFSVLILLLINNK